MADGTEEQQMTREQAAAIIDGALAREADPLGFEKAQRMAGVDADFAPILAVADDDTKAKAQGLIEARKAAIEAEYAAPEPVADSMPSLGVPAVTGSGKSIWSACQHVEPERDGLPWCTWEDAARMLTLSAQAAMRGANGVKASGHRFARDEQAMTLTLELV